MQDKLTSAGGLVAAGAAVLASSCCGIPLALTLIGVSSGAVGLIAHLAPLRGVLLAAAVLLIAAGWIFTLRARSRALRGGACRRGRFRANFVVLGLSTILLAAALAEPLWEPLLTHSLVERVR